MRLVGLCRNDSNGPDSEFDSQSSRDAAMRPSMCPCAKFSSFEMSKQSSKKF